MDVDLDCEKFNLVEFGFGHDENTSMRADGSMRVWTQP